MAVPYGGGLPSFDSMLDELRDRVPRCDGVDCDRTLPEEPTLVFRTDAGERRAYECPCGAITMTVVDSRRR